MSTITQITRLENSETGEVIDIWLDISIEHHSGDDITPPESYYEITNWGEQNTDSQPSWVTDIMLNNALYSIDLNNIETSEKDYDKYD